MMSQSCFTPIFPCSNRFLPNVIRFVGFPTLFCVLSSEFWVNFLRRFRISVWKFCLIPLFARKNLSCLRNVRNFKKLSHNYKIPLMFQKITATGHSNNIGQEPSGVGEEFSPISYVWRIKYTGSRLVLQHTVWFIDVEFLHCAASIGHRENQFWTLGEAKWWVNGQTAISPDNWFPTHNKTSVEGQTWTGVIDVSKLF